MRPVLVVEVLWVHGKWPNAFGSGALALSGEREKTCNITLILHSMKDIRKPEMTSQKLLMEIISGGCPGMLQHPGVSAGT